MDNKGSSCSGETDNIINTETVHITVIGKKDQMIMVLKFDRNSISFTLFYYILHYKNV